MTDDHYLCLFAFQFRPFFLQQCLIVLANLLLSSAINSVSSAYLKLFTLFLPTLIPGYPSKFRIIISPKREKVWGNHIFVCQQVCLFVCLFVFVFCFVLFFRGYNELISPSARITDACSQHVFLITCKTFQLCSARFVL